MLLAHADPDTTLSNGVVRASGAIVVRPMEDDIEVLLIHRPGYRDWSFPKGKDDPGESSEEAALRELHEETGYRGRLVTHLEDQEYRLSSGRQKVVRYFAARTVVFDGFRPGREVDETRWVPITKATRMLTYKRDRQLLEDPRLIEIARSGTVYVIRHAHAGDRSTWAKDDRDRPISPKGRAQTKALTAFLAARGVGSIHSSPYKRCLQTVKPLSKALDLEVNRTEALAEGTAATKAMKLITSVAGTDAALCTHGDLIVALLEQISDDGAQLAGSNGVIDCQKGAIWELEVCNGVPVKASYLGRPLSDTPLTS